MKQRTVLRLFAGVAFAMTLLLAPRASAQLGERQAMPPLYFGAGLGASIPIDNGDTAFKLEEHVGYRFFMFNLTRELDAALFAGAQFGQAFSDTLYLFEFDVRFGADFEVYDQGDLQVLVTPALTLGGGLLVIRREFAGTRFEEDEGAFNLGFAMQGEVVLLEGLLGIWLRPLGFNFFLRDNGVERYEFMTGVNIRI